MKSPSIQKVSTVYWRGNQYRRYQQYNEESINTEGINSIMKRPSIQKVSTVYWRGNQYRRYQQYSKRTWIEGPRTRVGYPNKIVWNAQKCIKNHIPPQKKCLKIKIFWRFRMFWNEFCTYSHFRGYKQWICGLDHSGSQPFILLI